MSGLSPDARALIDEARPQERLADDRRRHLRRALAVKIAGAAAASAVSSAAAATSKAAASASLAGGVGLLGKVVVGAGLVAAVAAGGHALSRRTVAKTSAPAAAPATAHTAQASEPSSPSSGQTAAAPPPTGIRAAQEVPKSLASRPKRVQAPEPSLDAELEGLRAAQVELRSGHPDRALAMLDDRSFAHGGALEEERSAARIVALCQLGRVDQARLETTRFQRAFPRSPLLARVRQACRATE